VLHYFDDLLGVIKMISSFAIITAIKHWNRLVAGLIVLFCALFLSYSSSDAQQGITPCAAFSVSVSGTSANQQLSACGGVVILMNVSTQELFYTYGATSATTATTSNFSLPGNSFITLNLGVNRQYVAAITATSTTTLRITQGQTR
jgi:hypothetical protein